MISDKELADRVVALGIGELLDPDFHERSYYHFDSDTWFSSDFVSSWVVAGALMEKCAKADAENGRDTYFIGPFRDTQNMNFPRAIIEACVEALEGNGVPDERLTCLATSLGG